MQKIGKLIQGDYSNIKKSILISFSVMALVLFFVLTSVMPTQASGNVRFNERFEKNFIVLNPCTNSLVSLYGDVHVQGNLFTRDETFHINVHLDAQFSGVDANSDHFVGIATARLNWEGWGPLSFGTNLLLINQGPGEKFALNLIGHFTPANGNWVWNVADETCRGHDNMQPNS